MHVNYSAVQTEARPSEREKKSTMPLLATCQNSLHETVSDWMMAKSFPPSFQIHYTPLLRKSNTAFRSFYFLNYYKWHIGRNSKIFKIIKSEARKDN